MTKDKIAKLPTPLSNAHYGEEWDGDGSNLCRSLEQRLAAAVMALDKCLLCITTPRGLNPDTSFVVKECSETLAAIRGDK